MLLPKDLLTLRPGINSLNLDYLSMKFNTIGIMLFVFFWSPKSEVWFELNQRIFHDTSKDWLDRWGSARLLASSCSSQSKFFEVTLFKAFV